jgi:hypothetical protein
MIDEFTLLPGTLKDKVGGDVQTYSTPMLTEGRKVDLEIIWGSHSDRAEALGLKGKYDLLECFDVIVYLKHVNGERYAYINFGEGLDKGTRYQLPGPFVLPGQPAGELSVERRTSELVEPDDQSPLSFTVVSDAESGEVEPDRPSPADEVVMVAFFTVKDECAADGRHFAWSQVCDKLGISPGGKQYGRIKAILDRWGIDYQDL